MLIYLVLNFLLLTHFVASYFNNYYLIPKEDEKILGSARYQEYYFKSQMQEQVPEIFASSEKSKRLSLAPAVSSLSSQQNQDQIEPKTLMQPQLIILRQLQQQVSTFSPLEPWQSVITQTPAQPKHVEPQPWQPQSPDQSRQYQAQQPQQPVQPQQYQQVNVPHHQHSGQPQQYQQVQAPQEPQQYQALESQHSFQPQPYKQVHGPLPLHSHPQQFQSPQPQQQQQYQEAQSVHPQLPVRPTQYQEAQAKQFQSSLTVSPSSATASTPAAKDPSLQQNFPSQPKASSSKLKSCFTIGGPDIGRSCIFPFKYNGETYFGCPIDPEDSTKRWCSTKTDANGNHMIGQNAYGHCSSGCPLHNDRSSSLFQFLSASPVSATTLPKTTAPVTSSPTVAVPTPAPAAAPTIVPGAHLTTKPSLWMSDLFAFLGSIDSQNDAKCNNKTNFSVKGKNYMVSFNKGSNCPTRSWSESQDFCQYREMVVISPTSADNSDSINLLGALLTPGTGAWTDGFVSHISKPPSVIWTSTAVNPVSVTPGDGLFSTTGDDGRPQPDNFLFRSTGKAENNENCIALFNSKNNDGIKLHDMPCSTKLGVICQSSPAIFNYKNILKGIV